MGGLSCCSPDVGAGTWNRCLNSAIKNALTIKVNGEEICINNSCLCLNRTIIDGQGLKIVLIVNPSLWNKGCHHAAHGAFRGVGPCLRAHSGGGDHCPFQDILINMMNVNEKAFTCT